MKTWTQYLHLGRDDGWSRRCELIHQWQGFRIYEFGSSLSSTISGSIKRAKRLHNQKHTESKTPLLPPLPQTRRWGGWSQVFCKEKNAMINYGEPKCSSLDAIFLFFFTNQMKWELAGYWSILSATGAHELPLDIPFFYSSSSWFEDVWIACPDSKSCIGFLLQNVATPPLFLVSCHLGCSAKS